MKPTRCEADVNLLLEGTYPYVRGGVSAWVHELIGGLPEISFSLVHLCATRKDVQAAHYTLPPNVVGLQCHALMDPANAAGKPHPCEGSPAYLSAATTLHEWFRDPTRPPSQACMDSMLGKDAAPDARTAQDFFYSRGAWTQMLDHYNRNCPDAAFQAYFWAVRNTHAPLMRLLSLVDRIAPARLHHSVSTGYAGLLGAMLKQRTGRPLILTEHGIYTKERKIDLMSAFLKEHRDLLSDAPESGMQYHQQLWLRLFEGIGRLAYEAANPIITLYERNQTQQIRDGADPARTMIIPNGVDIDRYAPLRMNRPEKTPRVIGLIGRVVPIKDIKTFIRAIRVLANQLPDVQGWLIGPEEENPAYVEECRALVRTLQLERHICFLGFRNVCDVLPQLGLLALTSISEAFPLVIGESHASGLPVVATDVGACRDLIEGRDPEDRALGPAGEVVPMVDHEAFAAAAYQLLTDPTRWKRAQQAGITRVERYYRQHHVVDSYRRIYMQLRDAPWQA